MVALVLAPAWWAFDVKLGPLAAESQEPVSIGVAPIPTPLRPAPALACFSVRLPTFLESVLRPKLLSAPDYP